MRRALPVALCIVASFSLVWCGGQYTDAPEEDAGGTLPDSTTGATDVTASSSSGSSSGQTGVPDSSPNDQTDASSNGGISDASTTPNDATTKSDATTGTDAGGGWEQLAFTEVKAFGTCTGARYVKYSAAYNLWIGVIRCSATQYKLHLSATKTGSYYEIADGANGGEDHCELVNPAFSSNDFSTCAACSIGSSLGGSGNAPPVGVYTRSLPGEQFKFNTKWPTNNYYSPQWYKCGVSIP